jgi:hypothetical protein
MYTLSNASLEIAVLDPVADRERFGTRYCTGGYIYQVTDARHGPLLSGPTYPDSFNWFDGQGIPDAFNLGPLAPPGSDPATPLIIGIGRCDTAANRILELCTWEVEQAASELRMRTSHAYGGYALELERTVSLHGRTVRSHTRLHNTGERFVPLRWFPHPFYPQTETDELCRVNIPVRVPENPSYEIAPSGFIARRGWPWQDGRYQALDHHAHTNLVIQQRHPLLGLVAATCSYVPTFFPIWGNPRTFSWEPFLERIVATGQEAVWWIDYDF